MILKKSSEAIQTSKMPVSNIQWVHREQLTANDYNPNYVAGPEMKLLKTSIMENGWTVPLVIDENGVIIDGFHRFVLSADPELYALTEGWVPVTILTAIDQNLRRLATIRHNRARGTHAVVEMASIVRFLIEHGMTAPEIQARLGMDEEEVFRLSAKGGMPAQAIRVQKELSKGWTPTEKK